MITLLYIMETETYVGIIILFHVNDVFKMLRTLGLFQNGLIICYTEQQFFFII